MAAVGARAARSFALASLILAILGYSGQAQEWQCGQTAAVNPPSPEEMKTSLIVNQLAIIHLIRDISNTLEGMAEKVAQRDEEAAARDERLQETLKGMAAQQAALRQERTNEVASLREEVAAQGRLIERVYEVPACPDGWLRRESSCYLIVQDTDRSWDNSLKYCKGRGGDLAKITSAEENEFIKAHLGTYCCYWIGLNDRETEGRFVWTDGTLPTYTRWAAGQPNGGEGQDCVYMHRHYDGKWTDNTCSIARSVVCERPVHA